MFCNDGGEEEYSGHDCEYLGPAGIVEEKDERNDPQGESREQQTQSGQTQRCYVSGVTRLKAPERGQEKVADYVDDE